MGVVLNGSASLGCSASISAMSGVSHAAAAYLASEVEFSRAFSEDFSVRGNTLLSASGLIVNNISATITCAVIMIGNARCVYSASAILSCRSTAKGKLKLVRKVSKRATAGPPGDVPIQYKTPLTESIRYTELSGKFNHRTTGGGAIRVITS